MKKLIIITAITLFIQGCATPYQSSGFAGGYEEVQLDEAELTLENGFKYFVIVDGFTTTVISKPGVTNTIVLYKEKPDSVFPIMQSSCIKA